MSRFLAERLTNLKAYVPGEQPTDTQYIKLNTNESPYPPPPSVINAISSSEMEKLRLYPNPDGNILLKNIAEFYSVEPKNVIIGNGSDELLAFAFLAFCGKTRGIAFPDITYGFYTVYAQLYDIPAEQLPLRDDFTIDPADYCNINKNIVIANPNAPTGIFLQLSDVEAICKSNPDYVVIVDEAYIDFGGESAIPLTGKYENLLVVHTYSKSRSMAGARLAYMIGHSALIDDINRIKYSFNPYNVNRLTQLAGSAALKDGAYYKEKCSEIIDTREFTAAELKKLGFTMTDSKANFIFARHDRISGREFYQELRERGILVRQWDAPRIADYLRITVGTPEQMRSLIKAITEILKEGDK